MTTLQDQMMMRKAKELIDHLSEMPTRIKEAKSYCNLLEEQLRNFERQLEEKDNKDGYQQMKLVKEATAKLIQARLDLQFELDNFQASLQIANLLSSLTRVSDDKPELIYQDISET